MRFSYDLINIKPEIEANVIIKNLKEYLKKFKKRGYVIGVSGGIDSSVVLGLCANAVGSEKVIALSLPENESSEENIALVKKLTVSFGVKLIEENLSSALNGFKCYDRRDEAIKNIFPEFDSTYKAKIVLSNGSNKNPLNVFYLKIIAAGGEEKMERLPLNEYLKIVAASNFKQRCRMNMLYYYADANNFAVAGTANKDEHEQGFFVKYGDGGADIKPISHLFKTQIYQLAEYLNIPAEIRSRIPTTDTYSAEQTQEEFFFKKPFDVLDRVWFGVENGFSSKEISDVLEISFEEVEEIMKDIIRKKNNTEYLRN
jgi:NAD+ synthase